MAAERRPLAWTNLGSTKATLDLPGLTLYPGHGALIQLSEADTARLATLLCTRYLPEPMPRPCPICHQPFIHDSACEGRCAACRAAFSASGESVCWTYGWLVHDWPGCQGTVSA